MRTFLGMILGCLLTIVVVYMHDTMATSTVANANGVSGSQQIVNWTVASSEWNKVKENIRLTWIKLTSNVG